MYEYPTVDTKEHTGTRTVIILVRVSKKVVMKAAQICAVPVGGDGSIWY